MAIKSQEENIKALEMCSCSRDESYQCDCTKCPYVTFADELGNQQYDCKDLVMLDALEYLKNAAVDKNQMVEELSKVMGNHTLFEQGFHFALEEVKAYGNLK